MKADTITRKARDRVSTSDPFHPRFHFIGGKGGVGKTTCAAAFALLEASSRRDVLVASTDPAPSLGDAFAVKLGATPKRVTAHLDAVEIDAQPALRRWISLRRAALEEIALQGTWLDREDVNRLLTLSLPGIDEVAALLELSRLARNGRYDVIVVDTAPTGHTLRMLAMPETLFGLARVFDGMREKHRVMVEALRGAFQPEEEDALIDELADESRALAAMLRDRETTRISWITLPEPMAIAETLDALAELAARGLTVSEVIVNRLTPERRAKCSHCDARRAFETQALRALPQRIPLCVVLASDDEPRGLTALKRIGTQLAKADAFGHKSLRHRGRTKVLRYTAASPVQARAEEDSSSASATPSLKLLLFGGKGGVGKTTCAAATALDIAAAAKTRRVLLISTDPAHSLGDVLGLTLSDGEALLTATSNLTVRELDAGRVLDEMRRKYASAIDEIFERLGAGRSFDASHDRSVLHGLIDLAPPGLDELAAIIEIADALNSENPRWDLAVIDTAPTGHALRLLELPSLMHDWTKALMSILLKYQPVTGLGSLGSLLLKLSRGLGMLRELLVDPARTHFVVVTRAATLPSAESERLLARLGRLGIHVPAVIVNAVGRGTCGPCRKAAQAEQREMVALRRRLRRQRVAMIVAPTQIPPPRGARELRAWRRTAWYR